MLQLKQKRFLKLFLDYVLRMFDRKYFLIRHRFLQTRWIINFRLTNLTYILFVFL